MNKQEDKKYYYDLHKVALQSERQEKKQKMRKRFIIFLLCFVCLLTGIFSTYFVFKKIYPKYDYNSTHVMGEVEYTLKNYWLYGNEYEDLLNDLEDKALYGMTSFVDDPYTTYMSYDEQYQFYSSINMDYVGIGVEYAYFNNVALIKKVFKDSPAEKAGIMPGDIIVAIDGKSVENMASDDIKENVLGQEGSDVIVTVSRKGTDIDFTVTRASVSYSSYAYQEDNYVVLQINSFGANTEDEIINYLDDYQDYEAIIIDLRDNSGGLQSSVKQISGLFIGPDKVYLRQEDSQGNKSADYTQCKKTYDNFKKIVVLVNENTASAAEVLAICLKQQHDNVTIVGMTTYGKGVIQSQRLLSNGGSLKYTSYYWYSPDGDSINKVGIIPDVEVKMPDLYYEYYYQLAENESYGLDTVSNYTRICQLALNFIGYYEGRTDGYFDQEFADCLCKFKADNGLGNEALIDSETYDLLISHANYELLNNAEKDNQMLKAKEIVKDGNNN